MLTDEEMGHVLYALATGSVDQAREVIAASRDLEEAARSSLLEVLAIDPVLFFTKLVLDGFKEFGSRKGIGDGDSYFIRLTALYHLQGQCNVVAGFSDIAVL